MTDYRLLITPSSIDLLPLTIVFVSTFMHAGWNLLARSQQQRDIFLSVLLVVAVVAVGPALWAEWGAVPVLTAVYPLLLLTAGFESLYYFGLLRGYQSGDRSRPGRTVADAYHAPR